MPYGRGGAGNYAAEAQKPANDVEAQRPRVEEQSAANAEIAKAAAPANANEEYAHMGRGGAGNWFSPKELSKTGTFASSTDQVLASSAKESVPETRRTGRGGAGNVFDDPETERNKQQKEAMEIELKDMIAKDVEAGLVPPPAAFIRPRDDD